MNVKSIVVVVMFAVLVDKAVAGQCPRGCTCYEKGIWAVCSSLGLNYFPSGYFPDVKFLYLRNNNIASLDQASISGFPSITHIILDGNPINYIDIYNFLDVTNLTSFSCNFCGANEIWISRNMENLVDIQIANNNITDVHYIGEYLPKKPLRLNLRNNPLKLNRQKLISSNFVTELYLDGVDCSQYDSETFNYTELNILSLGNAKVSYYSFAHLHQLQELYLFKNPLKEVREGFSSPEQKLRILDLSNTKLEVLEIAALDGMATGSKLLIDNTPLACNCLYEDIFEWAQMKQVELSARCGIKEPCIAIPTSESPTLSSYY